MAGRKSLVVAAFAAVYLIWGSTYLAIKVAVATMPPLLMGGARFIVAGIAMWLLLPGDRRQVPSRSDLGWAIVLSGLMLLIGNGIVNVVETKMPSSLAALLVTSVPLWMALYDWALNRVRPSALTIAAIIVGFAGVAVLSGSSGGWVGGQVDFLFVGAILFGCSCWALGSVLSRRARIGLPLLRSIALQMFCGGVLLTLGGTVRGEWATLDLNAIGPLEWLAWAYLVVFGSLVAFTAYVWLLSVRSSALVSTYAFVNPVVAVLLGAALLDEPLGPRVVLGSTLVIGAVALVTYAKSRQGQAAKVPAPGK